MSPNYGNPPRATVSKRETSDELVSSLPSVDRIWGIWGSYYKPKAILYLLEGDYGFNVIRKGLAVSNAIYYSGLNNYQYHLPVHLRYHRP